MSKMIRMSTRSATVMDYGDGSEIALVVASALRGMNRLLGFDVPKNRICRVLVDVDFNAPKTDTCHVEVGYLEEIDDGDEATR